MPKKQRFYPCWKCGRNNLEWFGLKSAFRKRFKCFNCRIDSIDLEGTASESAERWRKLTKSKEYLHSLESHWKIWGVKTTIKQLFRTLS